MHWSSCNSTPNLLSSTALHEKLWRNNVSKTWKKGEKKEVHVHFTSLIKGFGKLFRVGIEFVAIEPNDGWVRSIESFICESSLKVFLLVRKLGHFCGF
jgi:hypothetical protein